MDVKKIVDSIDCIVKVYGFKKNKHSWKKTINDITIILALQKSRYSNSFTFEIGICIDAARKISDLKYYNCGISFRLNSIPAFRYFDIDSALQLELNNEELFLQFIEFLEGKGINSIMGFFSFEYIKELYAEGFFNDKMIDSRSVDILSGDGSN
ncbi:DUF4304 domain-containing protein [Salmonella enterica]|nr:DUF4304 domain-containing protein [Salmonella enterica]